MHGDNVELLVNEEDYRDIARVLTDCMHQIRRDYSSDCNMTKKLPTESESVPVGRNARFAYKALARFDQEVRAPPAVREYYARYMRKFEAEFPAICYVEVLGEEGDWDLLRRARTGREAAAGATSKGEAGVGKSKTLGGEEGQKSSTESESDFDEEMSSGIEDFGRVEDRRRDERQFAQTGNKVP